MYTYYILRGTRNDQPIETEGEISEEIFPNADRSDGPGLIDRIVNSLDTELARIDWQECDLTEEYFDRDDSYVFFQNRWQRRSETAYRNL